MKFMGLALENPVGSPQYFQYFLDPKHHKPGIPIDMISYHFYTMPDADETPETMQYTIFAQADKFLTAVRYIETIRKQLSPGTGTYIDKTGSMLPDPEAPSLPIPSPLHTGTWPGPPCLPIRMGTSRKWGLISRGVQN